MALQVLMLVMAGLIGLGGNLLDYFHFTPSVARILRWLMVGATSVSVGVGVYAVHRADAEAVATQAKTEAAAAETKRELAEIKALVRALDPFLEEAQRRHPSVSAVQAVKLLQADYGWTRSDGSLQLLFDAVPQQEVTETLEDFLKRSRAPHDAGVVEPVDSLAP